MDGGTFDYLVLLVTVAISVYFIGKYLLQVVKYVYYEQTDAEIVRPKVDKSTYQLWNYSYLVRYSVDGVPFESVLSGYSNPFEFEISERICIYVNLKNPREVFPGEGRGLILKILFKLSLTVLIFFSVMSSMQVLGIVSGSYKVPALITFFIMALVMLISSLNTRYILSNNSSYTNGIIKDFSRVVDFEKQVAFRPIVEFDHNGSVVRFESELMLYNTLKLGHEVRVEYVSDNPELAEISSFWSSWLMVLLWFTLLLIDGAILYNV